MIASMDHMVRMETRWREGLKFYLVMVNSCVSGGVPLMLPSILHGSPGGDGDKTEGTASPASSRFHVHIHFAPARAAVVA